MGSPNVLLPGQTFAGYAIDRVLGVGGMGTVYLAAHPRLPRRVALKLLHRSQTDNDYVRSRFEQEADHAARLEHPNIVAVYDRGREEDQLWIAMQYIEGTDLHQVLNDGPLGAARAVRIITDIASALDYAHEAGVLHRDVKPANILLEDTSARRPGKPGRVLLTDFGIAKVLDETQHLTKTGMLVASLQYAAPEQFTNTVLDARADEYSLGCTLFRMLTGQQPYPGSTVPQLIHGHLNMPIPRPSELRPELPRALDDVIARAMAKDRADRFTTCTELAEAARDALTETATPATVVSATPSTPAPETPTLAPPISTNGKPAAAPTAAPAQRRTPWWRRRSAMAAAAVGGVVIIVAATVAVSEWVRHGSSNEAQITVPFTGLDRPRGVAVDGSGNIYVADHGNHRILELAAGSTTPIELPFGDLNDPDGIAVDGSGNVYATDQSGNRVLKLPVGAAAAATLPFTNLDRPTGVGVDRGGNVYVLDYDNTRVVRLAAGSNTQSAVQFTAHNAPNRVVVGGGVAVDDNGNVYVTDNYPTNVDRVLELPAGSDKQSVLPFTELRYPNGVAVDGHGDVFVTDLTNRVLELPAGADSETELPFTGLTGPDGVAVGHNGTVYVADTNSNRVLELPGT
ncbi:protein kinase [Skermania sp. ID1734]|uniref:serine/threonine-protein kinase PknD n=1 Tax=Skermania sp. ID1734 TaxID=2597516 RepID=UPI00117F382F|nr:serine/threonine-protein kinase PknD [Skermania sp. ID1734]TSD93639.1 protein kinase [Skermania sp. ID1734]